MENKLRIYLDTSVINFIYADDAPEKMEITIDFFNNFVLTGKYDTYISEVVIAEIMDTNNSNKRQTLLDTVDKYPIDILEVDTKEEEQIEFLAEEYVASKIIPEKKIADAYHISTSVVAKIDYLVSWNFRHLANVNKEQKVRIVNLEHNYTHNLRIITPLELIDYEY